MTIAFIIVLVIAAVLGIAYYYQVKASRRQADEQQQLLTDYQRRVDEQQKLLDDYRALEKNFDNVGEGYEQALLAFDKMEEDQQKMRSANEALEKRYASLQDTHNRLTEDMQKRSATVKQVADALIEAARGGGDRRLTKLAGQLSDMDDLQADLPPLERNDNIMLTQLVNEAVVATGINEAKYVQFVSNTAPDAAATMISTNLQKAVRALSHLLDNAQKFTTEGVVTLLVNVDMEKMQASFAVEDTGTGIAADDAERIFEPYVKLNQYFDGQGIGLTVARNLARRLGGDVVLDADFQGSGSRFVLTLPI
jgi:signal transduction histidine kinase